MYFLQDDCQATLVMDRTARSFSISPLFSPYQVSTEDDAFSSEREMLLAWDLVLLDGDIYAYRMSKNLLLDASNSSKAAVASLREAAEACVATLQ